MACPPIHSGQEFVVGVLAHVDCQAKTIGSYGFGALADPQSPASSALLGLLTVFVALFGVRRLLDYPQPGHDLLTSILKVGIVLTLATSWPAWQILGYDLVIFGPEELSRAIGLASQLPGSGGDLANRLQNVDGGLASLLSFGSGRFGTAQGDWFQLGFARTAFLFGTLAPLSFVKLTTGMLLAVAPAMAGLLLFSVTRPIFAGWLKALAMAFFASIFLVLALNIELAVLEPWLLDALTQRAAAQQVLDAPVEVLVMTLLFVFVSLGILFLSGRIAFHTLPSMSILPTMAINKVMSTERSSVPPIHSFDRHDPTLQPRTQRLVSAIEDTVRRENPAGWASSLSTSGAAAPLWSANAMSNQHDFAANPSTVSRRRPRKTSTARRRDGQ